MRAIPRSREPLTRLRRLLEFPVPFCKRLEFATHTSNPVPSVLIEDLR